MGPIILTGPKHSGKTSAARVLAECCRGECIDLDELIERRTGRSPRALFREDPGIFRKAEAEALESLLKTPVRRRKRGEDRPRVIAAGGGLVDNLPALKIIKDSPEARLVYLEVSAETAWKRIRAAVEAGEELPPFLDTGNPEQTHFELHSRRAAAYKALAHFTVRGEEKTPERIGREILQMLSGSGLSGVSEGASGTAREMLMTGGGPAAACGGTSGTAVSREAGTAASGAAAVPGKTG